MIITQQIINGVCSVTKTGSYFNLISAGGVVRVKLTKNGSTVLDSKMWVGMNLDKAQPFDEVEIYGEDGPIEFWAGEISMQHFSFSNNAAKAIRTTQVPVIGETLITSPDFVRSNIKIRTDKDMWIGGQGVNGTGWFVPAGMTEEIPVAGSLFGYIQPPELNMDECEYLNAESGTVTDGGEQFNANIHIAENQSYFLHAKPANHAIFHRDPAGNNVWEEHPYFAPLAGWSHSAIIANQLNKTVYAFRHIANGTSEGILHIYESVDDGKNWARFSVIDWGAETDSDEVSNSYIGAKPSAARNTITWCQSGVAVGVNVKTKAVKILTSGQLAGGFNSAIRRVTFISDDLNTAVLTMKPDGINTGFYRYENGKLTAAAGIPEGVNVLGYEVDILGQHISLQCSDGLVRLSNDGGQSFLTVAGISGRNKTEQAPRHLVNGVFIGFYNKYPYSYYIANGVATFTQGVNANGSIDTHTPAFISNDGIAYVLSGAGSANLDRYQIGVTGDLTPAVVEVMEFLQ
ncbi:hypothetical protein AYI83_15845 [Shewanella algae]|uniref:hypothetical protein n=1 Tax=Shewanella algae TaxID=38313 RepID=UPI001184618A|nr:hypothetical protein [Shewanella algae]TVK95021.1 hypothetical protein AYI83_15845 [Shewanella algae]